MPKQTKNTQIGNNVSNFENNINVYLDKIIGSGYLVEVPLKKPEIIKSGKKSFIAKFEARKHPVIIKVRKSTSVLAREVNFLNSAREMGVRTPKVYSFRESNDKINIPFVLLEFVDAKTLSKSYSAQEMFHNGLARKMGSTLALMHQLKGVGFGRSRGREYHVGQFNTFSDYYHYYSDDDLEKMIANGDIEKKDLNIVKQALDVIENDLDKGTQPVVAHYDFGSPNVLDTNPLTVIDPDPIITHPYIDLAWSSIIGYASVSNLDENFKKDFLKGYSEKTKLNDKVFSAAVVLKGYESLVDMHGEYQNFNYLKNVINSYSALIYKKANLFFIEDFTPYDKSLKWKIHNNYFKKRGMKAWSEGEVPYRITSNNVAASQNVKLVYAAIEKMEEDGTLGKKQSIVVMEMASGLGLFAINFITEFEKLENIKKKGYFQRLKYLFTDYSWINLKDAMKNYTLSHYHKAGIVDFYFLDALEPETLISTRSKKKTMVPKLTAILANYVHCCLPLTILRKKNGKFYEKYVGLSLRIVKETKSVKSVDDVLKKLDNISENLVEYVSWKEIEPSFYKKEAYREVVEKAVSEYPVATVIYPYGSFASFEKSMPLLHPGGILVISDKGYSMANLMRGAHSCLPSVHGNSLAHSFNFPLFEKYVEKTGYSATRTKDPLYTIQTILVEKRKRKKLGRLFSNLFVRKNINQIASDFYQAGKNFENQKNFITATRFYERGRDMGLKISNLFFYLGKAYRNLGYTQKALKSFREGTKYDYFSRYDFNFHMGYLFHIKKDYYEAIKHYKNSLKFDKSSATYYNLGLCYETLGKGKNAHNCFQKAVKIDPGYSKAKKALERLM